ncbi:MAG: twin-arginine translocation signal domain-containing protein, partial [candidate division NC10 bacterium]
MSLSRRDFLKFGGATAAGVAVGSPGIDLGPVEAAATSLKIKEAKVSHGVCPYCAVGCAQLIYTKNNKIIDIEGDPDTPHTLGRLCPKGAATIQLSNNPLRPTKALYRAPGSDKWEEKPLEWMWDEIAKRVKATRDATFVEVEKSKDGADVVVNRTEGLANLGSACIDNEECYLLTKLMRTLGVVYLEHQARV